MKGHLRDSKSLYDIGPNDVGNTGVRNKPTEPIKGGP